MQLSRIAALAERVWIDVPEDPERTLQLEVIPGEASALGGALLDGSELGDRTICRRFFVGFRGYTDAGQPVPNTVENRLALLKWNPVRRALQSQGIYLNERIAQGEAGAGSA